MSAEKANRAAAEAGALFDRRLKWLARITWLRTLLFIAAVEVGLVGLLTAHNTKGMIGFAVLLLFGLLAICVTDLQYRITNTKVGLLKEIKLLRLEYLGQPTGQPAASPRESDSASTNLWRSLPLSLGEDVAWYAAMILVATASRLCHGLVTYFDFEWHKCTSGPDRHKLRNLGARRCGHRGDESLLHEHWLGPASVVPLHDQRR